MSFVVKDNSFVKNLRINYCKFCKKVQLWLKISRKNEDSKFRSSLNRFYSSSLFAILSSF